MTANDVAPWTVTPRTFLQASAGAAVVAAGVAVLDRLAPAPASAPTLAPPPNDAAAAARHARHRMEATEGYSFGPLDPWHRCERGCCAARTAHEF